MTERINAAVSQALELPEVRQQLSSTGNAMRIESPAQFRDTVRVTAAFGRTWSARSA